MVRDHWPFGDNGCKILGDSCDGTRGGILDGTNGGRGVWFEEADVDTAEMFCILGEVCRMGTI